MFQHLIMVVREWWEGFESCNAAKGSYSGQSGIHRRVEVVAAKSALSGAGAAVPDPGSVGCPPRASLEGIAGSGTPPASSLQHPATLTRIGLWETHAIWRKWSYQRDRRCEHYCAVDPSLSLKPLWQLASWHLLLWRLNKCPSAASSRWAQPPEDSSPCFWPKNVFSFLLPLHI